MWETGKTVNVAKEIVFETKVNEKTILANNYALIVLGTSGGVKARL